MSDLLKMLRALGPAFFDAWYVVDDEDRIVEFNPAFHALFPRAMARDLPRSTCRQVVSMAPCQGDHCLRATCQKEGSLRLDEVEAQIAGETLRLVVGATPLTLASGKPGALIILRNVTDDARVQARYQQMMDAAAREQASLVEQLSRRTRDLLAANQELNHLEAELARLKRER